MENKINENLPDWMIEYHEGKTIGCHCKNCLSRYGKPGSLSIKQRQHLGTYRLKIGGWNDAS